MVPYQAPRQRRGLLCPLWLRGPVIAARSEHARALASNDPSIQLHAVMCARAVRQRTHAQRLVGMHAASAGARIAHGRLQRALRSYQCTRRVQVACAGAGPLDKRQLRLLRRGQGAKHVSSAAHPALQGPALGRKHGARTGVPQRHLVPLATAEPRRAAAACDWVQAGVTVRARCLWRPGQRVAACCGICGALHVRRILGARIS